MISEIKKSRPTVIGISFGLSIEENGLLGSGIRVVQGWNGGTILYYFNVQVLL